MQLYQGFRRSPKHIEREERGMRRDGLIGMKKSVLLLSKAYIYSLFFCINKTNCTQHCDTRFMLLNYQKRVFKISIYSWKFLLANINF